MCLGNQFWPFRLISRRLRKSNRARMQRDCNLDNNSCAGPEAESTADTVGLLGDEQSGGQNISTDDVDVSTSVSNDAPKMVEMRDETFVNVHYTRPERESSTTLPKQGGRSSGDRTNLSNNPPARMLGCLPGRKEVNVRKEEGDLRQRYFQLETENRAHKQHLADWNTQHASNKAVFEQQRRRLADLESREAQFETQLAGQRILSQKIERRLFQSENELRNRTNENAVMEGRYKSRMDDLENRNANLESDKAQLQVALTTLEIQYSKVSKSGSYTDNSATPTLAYDTLRRLSFTVDSFSNRLVKFMPEHSDQRSIMASKYSSVFFLRGPHFPVLTLKAEVMNILFEGFENESFTEAGHSVYLDDPVQRKKEFYALFQNFQTQNRGTVHASNSGWADMQFLKYYKRTKARVWQVVGTDNSEELEALDQEFRKAAQSVWTLHLLAFSFEPPASLFRVRNDAEFEKKYMEMAPGLQVDFKEDLLSKVAFMMTPGLQVDKFSVIKSEIYPRVPSSEEM